MIRFVKNYAWTATLAIALVQIPFAARAVAPDTGAASTDSSSGGFGSSTDPIVAKGKGFTVKRSQVDDAFLNFASRMAAQGRNIPEDARTEVRSNLLDYLVLNQILLQRATAEDKAKAREFVDKEITDARKNAPSPEAFDAQIKASGMTLDQFRDHAIDEQVCQRVLVRETSSVTDDQVKKFYEDNPKDFQLPERVRAAHILISTQDPATQQPLSADQKQEKLKLAKEVLAKAKKGDDFGALAKQYSDDPGSKDKGGEYTFARGKMVPEFEEAAFSLKPGQISDIVETRYGYHIIKLLEKMAASKAAYDTVTNDIRTYLVNQEVKKAEPAYAAKLRSEYDVKILEPAAPSVH